MRRQGISFRTEGSPLLGRLGLLNPGLAYALSLLGLTTITASLSVLLWALEPLMILFLAAWFLRERITPAFIVLSMIAVAGMVLIIYDPSSSERPADRRGLDHRGHRLLRRLFGRHEALDPGRQGDEPGDPGPAGARPRPRARAGRGRRRRRWPGRPDRADAARARQRRSGPARSTTPAPTGSTSAPCDTSRRRTRRCRSTSSRSSGSRPVRSSSASASMRVSGSAR